MSHLKLLNKAEYFNPQSIKEIKVICMTNKFINSLTTLLKATKEEQVIKLFACELNTVVRGPITEFAEKIFSQK